MKRMAPVADRPSRMAVPTSPIPDPIVFTITRDGATRRVEVPKAHAQRAVPQFPVLTFGMLHGARIVFRELA